MTETATPVFPVALPARRRWLWLWSAVTAALGIALMALNGFVRDVEAVCTERIVGWLSGAHAWAVLSQHTLYWSSHMRVAGLEVTPECSSAVLMGPLLLVGAALLLPGRFSSRRIVVALAVSCPILFLVNLARLSLIGWATSQWGYDGFDWSHTVVGALVAIAAVVISAGVLIFIVVRQGGRAQVS